MKKYMVYGLCLLALSWGCNSANKQADGHDHSHSEEQSHEGHDHSHEGHDHGSETEEHDHDHEGHDHSHEAHDHGSESEEHDHKHGAEGDEHDHEGHDHSHADHNHGNEISFTKAQAKASGLEVVTVQPAEFSQVIKTFGQILSATGDEVTVPATTNGIVSFYKAGANEGTAVKTGEALAAISSRKMLDGDPMQKAEAAFQVAEKDFKRAEALIKDKLISEKEYNEIKLTYENARIAYAATSGKQTEKGTNVTAPISGYIKNRLVGEGEYVEAGQPLYTITQNRKLQLRADVSESHYKDLATVYSANFKTPYSETTYQLSDMNGRLVSFGKSAGNNFYIPVLFEFDNVGEVLPGAYTEVYLLGKPLKEVISIPASSLTEEQGLYYVYVQQHEESYEKREVKTGVSDGKNVVISSGLKAGEKVVSHGAYHIKLSTASASIPHGHSH